MKRAPPALADAAGRRALVAKQHSLAAEPDRPAIAGGPRSRGVQVAAEIGQRAAAKLRGETVGHPTLRDAAQVETAATLESRAAAPHGEGIHQPRGWMDDPERSRPWSLPPA